MHRSLPSRHNAADTTIFTVMSTLAQQHNAINLSQGFPDFPIAAQLASLLEEAAREGYNQYAPMPGLPRLREAIAQDFLVRYGLNIDPVSEITITPGATYGLYAAFTALLQAGDEVIVLEPAYDSYIPNIEMNGAVAVPVPLNPAQFTPDWERIAAAVTARTRAIVVNTPHNPTGTVWSREDWDHLAALVQDKDIFIVSDEVYEQLVFDKEQHFSVLQHPVLRERSFALYSFGKAFHNTGWKIGYCISTPALTYAFRKLHQFMAFSVNTPAQYALSRFLDITKEAPARMLEQKRDFFLEQMKRTPFRILQPSKGSYFQLVSYAHLSSMPDREFAEWLTVEHGVATIPVSAFYSNGFDQKVLRFCFAKKEETINAAIERLAALVF